MTRLHELVASCAGDPAVLHAFIVDVSGPGFVDWPDVEPMASFEGLEATLIAEGAPRGLARRVAWKVLDIARTRQDRARMEAEDNPGRQPLDLARIVPIPAKVVSAGSRPGRRWMLENWGMSRPLGPVELKVAQEIAQRRGPRSARRPSSWLDTRARYTWWSEETPLRALELLARRYPALGLTLAIDGKDVPLGRRETAVRALSLASAIDALRGRGYSIERIDAHAHRVSRAGETAVVTPTQLRRMAVARQRRNGGRAA